MYAVTAPLDEHADTIPAPPPVRWDEEHGDEREEMLPPPPETKKSRR